jgi:hypothetical protein
MSYYFINSLSDIDGISCSTVLFRVRIQDILFFELIPLALL